MLLIAAMLFVLGAPSRAQEQVVRIGQAVPTVSFLPMWAARALDSFRQQGVRLQFVSIRGGDPTALAALDSGDIDFAAVGSDTPLEAIAKGQPFTFIYSLMSQVSLQLTVSGEFLKRTGVTPSDPVQKRLAALRGAIIGVAAVGGTQDRIARWLAAKGGLDPQHDIRVAQIGPPPAIHAALENHQIDGFLLSPPEGRLAEEANAGKILLTLGTEFPELRTLPYLVLVAKQPIDAAHHDLGVRTARALQAGSRAIRDDAGGVAGKIQQKFFPKLKTDVLDAAVKVLLPGIADDGRMTNEAIDHLEQFTAQSGGAKIENRSFFTNAIVDAALQGK